MEEPARLRVIPALEGIRLLLVEDDFIILTELDFVFIDAGAGVAGACRTVKDALVVAETGDFDAAILDVRIGGETVAPVARELARQGIPFVFYTGQGTNDPVCLEWPESSILPKPARQRDLIAAVADLAR